MDGWAQPNIAKNTRMSSGRRAGQRFDAEHQVTTEALLFLGELDPEGMGPSLEHATHYEATPVADFDALLAAAPIAPEASTFIDIGSGMGRVVMLAARLPFRRVIGVELSGALHEIARENLSGYTGPKWRCRDVRVIRRDALDYVFPRGNLVVFLYNPFFAPILARLVRNLLVPSAGGRDIVVLYHTAVHRAVFEETARFDIVADLSFGVVYRLRA